MKQTISNSGDLSLQVNIASNSGNLNLGRTTRWSQRFARLKKEVECDIRYGKFIDDLLTYNTKLDGLSTEEKLQDGQFADREIVDALRKKERYSKKLERNKNFETAQIIDVEIFAMIKLNFETYVEPLIFEGQSRQTIRVAVTEKIVLPIIDILNIEGQDDVFLNYSADDILGMIFFLTGKCHINWADYDRLQSSI